MGSLRPRRPNMMSPAEQRFVLDCSICGCEGVDIEGMGKTSTWKHHYRPGSRVLCPTSGQLIGKELLAHKQPKKR